MKKPDQIGALIVEDEPLARSRLREFIARTPWLTCVGEVTSGGAAVAAMDEVQPDLVFLDIQLPGMTGIEVLRRVTHRCAVIFTTAHDRFAVSAFELGALDYLLKPFAEGRFARAVERARPFIALQAGVPAAERLEEALQSVSMSRLFVRDGQRVIPLATNAIERIEASDDYVVVHAAGRCYEMRVLLAELEERLDPRTFLRIHRSHIVNLDHVRSLEPYDGSRFQITMRSGTQIVASRQRSALLRHLAR
ncbi:MAG: LytR/AlgR family response regulator transcription factor [Vicinamibacterales bacterium]